VYNLDGERSLVQTVDFFTPIVDDPFIYGQIAAANALSDVYAMGGRPLTALAIAAFPKDGDRSVLATIFRGGLDKLAEAGVALLGGHTVQDTEIKFGYAVTGDVLTAKVWSNAGAQPGDELILTKALGTGIISTALKFERAPAEASAAAIRSMITLNRLAAEALQSLPAHAVRACTDVTGFGLIGHACEMAAASGCTLEFDGAAIPLLPGVRALVKGNVPGGGRTNAQHFGPETRVLTDLDPEIVQLLYDPQTSGGLLVAIHAEHVGEAANALHAAGVPAARIGRVLPPTGARVTVL
jgi:selenide, water dikinase